VEYGHIFPSIAGFAAFLQLLHLAQHNSSARPVQPRNGDEQNRAAAEAAALQYLVALP
jgi:hypothetical protein